MILMGSLSAALALPKLLRAFWPDSSRVSVGDIELTLLVDESAPLTGKLSRSTVDRLVACEAVLGSE
jgi:hypothetical protein